MPLLMRLLTTSAIGLSLVFATQSTPSASSLSERSGPERSERGDASPTDFAPTASTDRPTDAPPSPRKARRAPEGDDDKDDEKPRKKRKRKKRSKDRRDDDGNAKKNDDSQTKRRSKKPKSSKDKSQQKNEIRATDHLERVLEHEDAHSLWILLGRSGISYFKLKKKIRPVDLRSCKDLIRWMKKKKRGYKRSMGRYLKSLGVPRGWEEINKEKIQEFKKKYRKGIYVKSKYYHILSTSNPQTTRLIAKNMDLMTSEVYHEIFSFEEKIKSRYILRFWKDEPEYLTKGGGMDESLAHFNPETKELAGFNTKTDWQLSHIGPFESLYHEGWHQYFNFYIPNVPRWYDEGFAEIVSPTDFKRGRPVRRFNQNRYKMLMKHYHNDELLDLKDLIMMGHREFVSPGVVSIAYAQSWSFIHFLLHYRDPNRKTQRRVRNLYRDYFWELRRGTDPKEAVDIVFKDVKFETLERRWRASLPKLSHWK